MGRKGTELKVRFTKQKNSWTTLKISWNKAKSMKSKVKLKNYEELLAMMTLMPQLSEKNGKKCETLLWKHSVKPTKRTQLPTLMEVNNLRKRRTKNKRKNNFSFFLEKPNLFCYMSSSSM